MTCVSLPVEDGEGLGRGELEGTMRSVSTRGCRRNRNRHPRRLDVDVHHLSPSPGRDRARTRRLY